MGASVVPDHVAVPYSDAAELAARLAPRLVSSLAAGGAVLAVVAAPERDALVRELGVDAERVRFADPLDEHAVPAFTVAVRWARMGRSAGARAVVVGQQVDLPDRGPEHWARLHIALNVAIEGLPVTVLCPHRSSTDRVSAGGVSAGGVEQTHPLLLTADGPRRSAAYRPPPEAVVDFPPPPPPALGPPDVAVPFGPAELLGLRRRVAAVGRSAGCDPDRVSDLVLVVNELATNSVEHGAGFGTLTMWIGPHGVTAEIADHGRMNVPFPGLVAPSPAGARGRGLWLASELTDVLQVWSDGDGTVVRVSASG